MSKAKDHSLTPTELEIMSALWETGPANVQTIQQRLPRELAYTTVQLNEAIKASSKEEGKDEGGKEAGGKP